MEKGNIKETGAWWSGDPTSLVFFKVPSGIPQILNFPIIYKPCLSAY